MREQLARALAHADAADVEEVRPVIPWLSRKRVAVAFRRHVDADADDLVRHALVAEAATHHAPLLLGVVRDRARPVEDRLVRRETDRGFLVRGRNEDRALGHERQAKHRRVVDVREEQDVVVLAADA